MYVKKNIILIVDVVSSGSITINEDSSVQILAEEACSVDQLDAQVLYVHSNCFSYSILTDFFHWYTGWLKKSKLLILAVNEINASQTRVSFAEFISKLVEKMFDMCSIFPNNSCSILRFFY